MTDFHEELDNRLALFGQTADGEYLRKFLREKLEEVIAASADSGALLVQHGARILARELLTKLERSDGTRTAAAESRTRPELRRVTEPVAFRRRGVRRRVTESELGREA